MTHHTCTDRTAGETMPEYAARVLRYALTYGIEPLSREQLAQADSAAQRTVCNLPKELSATDATLDRTLHTLRLRIAAEQQRRRDQLANLQRLFGALDQEPQGPDPGAQEPTPEDDQARALRLLRAALILVMKPQDGNGPGSGARLIKPRPNLPPGGIALQTPTKPRQDDGIIQF